MSEKFKLDKLINKQCLFGVPGNEALELIVNVTSYPKTKVSKLLIKQMCWKIEFESGRSAVITNNALKHILLHGFVKYKLHGKIIRCML